MDSTATRPNYLNLNANSSLGRLNQSSPSPASSRMVSRMTTLHEEKPNTSPVAIASSPLIEIEEPTQIEKVPIILSFAFIVII